MTVTDTPRTGLRALLASTSRWLDAHAAWAMSSSQSLAAREWILAQQQSRVSDQWTRSTDEDAVAREMAR